MDTKRIREFLPTPLGIGVMLIYILGRRAGQSQSHPPLVSGPLHSGGLVFLLGCGRVPRPACAAQEGEPMSKREELEALRAEIAELRSKVAELAHDDLCTRLKALEEDLIAVRDGGR